MQKNTITHYTTTPQGRQLAYCYTQGASPALLFCGGFRSDMQGSKALALEAYCQAIGNAYMRFDYSGHGQSAGKFDALTLHDWLEDTLHVCGLIIQKKLIIVGSSMGSWLGLHAALVHQANITAFIGIASAPDFTSRLMMQGFDATQRAELATQGKVQIHSEYGDYDVTDGLLSSGDALAVLQQPIALSCPVHLLHGMQDTDVPYDFSLQLAKQLVSNTVTLHLIKDGDHRLSRSQDLELLRSVCTLALA
jgi:pimeloyl-ACP methyl ester carboxylesterase